MELDYGSYQETNKAIDSRQDLDDDDEEEEEDDDGDTQTKMKRIINTRILLQFLTMESKTRIKR